MKMRAAFAGGAGTLYQAFLKKIRAAAGRAVLSRYRAGKPNRFFPSETARRSPVDIWSKVARNSKRSKKNGTYFIFELWQG